MKVLFIISILLVSSLSFAAGFKYKCNPPSTYLNAFLRGGASDGVKSVRFVFTGHGYNYDWNICTLQK